jgi:uncharacterized membrane protein YqjE
MAQHQPPRGAPEPSLGTLFGNFVGNLQDLIRGEMRLARQEIKEEAQAAAVGVGMMAAAGALALVGLIFVGLMLTYALTRLVPDWAAALIVAVLMLAGALIFFSVGRQRLAKLDPVPHQTIASLKEDTQWIKQQVSSDQS